MAPETKFDTKIVLDGLGQGVLIFGSDGRLIHDNLAARTLLGQDLNVIRSQGWEAAVTLFNARQTNPDEQMDAVRDRALSSPRPVRFQIYRSGEHLPCWAAAVQAEGGEVCTMVTLDSPDWSAVTSLVDKFRGEVQEAIEATEGHIDLINQTLKHAKPTETVESMGKRVGGFLRLIDVHMHRVGRLIDMLERLEHIRVGALRELVRERRKKITLADFFEDFVEQLDEIELVDPETEDRDHRARMTVDVPSGLAVAAPSLYLTRILRDILRNAIMYSMRGTPVKVTASARPQGIQIDIVDEGYGVREKEREKVFELWARARQPQIVAEFGYGLSLYLCKHEVEAMNGRLWFESTEGVGTTFSLMLPPWQDEAASVSSSDTSST